MSEITREPSQLDTQLITWATDYASQPDNKLALLDYDPDRFPGQMGHEVKGNPGPGALVDSVATAAQPLYPELKYQLSFHDLGLDYIGELTKGGINVALVTNHGDLIDIAIAHAATYSLLRHKNYQPKTAIVISKMISYLAYDLGAGTDPAPCAEILKVLEDHIFLSYPRTESTTKRGIASLLPDEIKRHNRSMRKDVAKVLGHGGVLLAVAASGTTDKPNSENADEIVLGTVGTGTVEMLSAKRTYIAPLAISYAAGSTVMKMCDIPRLCDGQESVTNAMEAVASTLTEETGIRTTYSRPQSC